MNFSNNITDPHWQAKLSSLTQYPSIPTYHKINPVGKGHLIEERSVAYDGPVHLTEKIDGTNARIVVFPTGMWFIGGRTDWLTACGDVVYNPKNAIVHNLRDTARSLSALAHPGKLTVVYTESYGGGTGAAWRNYTGDKNTLGHRVFDVFTLTLPEWEEIMARPIEEIAGWRDRLNQPFLGFEDLTTWAAAHDLDTVPTIATVDATELPTGITETEEWLQHLLSDTRVALDADAKGTAEGVILRSPDRKQITKARHEDYARTARVHHQAVLNANSVSRRKPPASLQRRTPPN